MKYSCRWQGVDSTLDLKFGGSKILTQYWLYVCKLSNDSEKILPGSRTLPKSVRLRNFFHFWEINFLYQLVYCSVKFSFSIDLEKALSCNLHWMIGAFLSFKFKFQKWWVNIFQKEREWLFCFPPTSIECSFGKKQGIYFHMRNIRQAPPCIKSSQILKKKT